MFYEQAVIVFFFAKCCKDRSQKSAESPDGYIVVSLNRKHES
jgi:hypothetical protein